MHQDRRGDPFPSQTLRLQAISEGPAVTSVLASQLGRRRAASLLLHSPGLRTLGEGAQTSAFTATSTPSHARWGYHSTSLVGVSRT